MSFEVKNIIKQVKSCSVRWKLSFPGNSMVRESPRFEFGNGEFCLRCTNGTHTIHLDLKSTSTRPENNPTLPSSCIVQVESSSKIQSSCTLKLRPELSYDLFGTYRIWTKRFNQGFAQSFELTFIVILQLEKSENLTDEKCVQTSLSVDTVPCSDGLSEDLGKLLDSDSNPDIEFQSGGQSIKAHRLVVSARSPVLSRMLQSQMVEDRTGVVKIEDMDFDTLKLFLHYLYTGRLDEMPTFKEAMDLYEAADKYQVPSLAMKCSQSLVEGLTVENACDVLDVAERHSDKKFVEEVVLFIIKMRVPSISQHWRGFCSCHPLLANEILNRYIEELTGSSAFSKKRSYRAISAEFL